MQKGIILLEALAGLVIFFLLGAASARMLSSSHALFQKTIRANTCRRIAEKQACFLLPDDKFTEGSFHETVIEQVRYQSVTRSRVYSSGKNLFLITIVVSPEHYEERCEISFIKKK